MSCKRCEFEGCIGYYLLHPAEFGKIEGLKQKQLEEDPNTTFELILSPSSGETFGRFKELHIIQKQEVL